MRNLLPARNFLSEKSSSAATAMDALYETLDVRQESFKPCITAYMGNKQCNNFFETSSSDTHSIETLYLNGIAVQSEKEYLTPNEREESNDSQSQLIDSNNTHELKLITEELKQQREFSSQIQEKISNSISNFNQLVEGLSGTLTLIPTLLNQLLQHQQAYQFSYVAPQSRQPSSIIFSPSSQLIPQQSCEQSTASQCLWLYHHQSADNEDGKLAFSNP